MEHVFLKDRSDEEDYRTIDGERSSHVKLAVKSSAEYKREVEPSFRDLTLMPDPVKTEKEHFLLGNAVDGWLSTKDKSLWEGLPKRLTAGSNKVTRQRVVGCCMNMARQMRAEYGSDWREHAITQFVIAADIETDSGPLRCKMRGDCLIPPKEPAFVKGALDYVDWKSSSFPDRIVTECDKWMYDISACHYIAVMEAAGFYVNNYRLAFVDSKYPFLVKFWDMPLWMIEAAKPRWLEALNRIAEGRLNGDWPESEPGVEDYERPAWHAFKYEQEVQWGRVVDGE